MYNFFEGVINIPQNKSDFSVKLLGYIMLAWLIINGVLLAINIIGLNLKLFHWVFPGY
jgi:hypothetical protein